MAGSSASKKVARAARTGGGRRRNINANMGFYSVLLVLALLGTGLVAYSRDARLNEVNGGSAPRSQEAADGGDRWVTAVGFYVCDKFVPNINKPDNPEGFSTRDDGVIYTNPVERSDSGSNANLGAFARAVGLQLDRDSFKLPKNIGQTDEPVEYIDGETKCGDKNGNFVVKVFKDAKNADSGEVREGDPNRILLKNNQAITIAFVAEGDENVPIPPSAATLDQAQARANEAAAAAAAAAGQGGPGAPGIPTVGGSQTPIEVTPQTPAGSTPAPAAP